MNVINVPYTSTYQAVKFRQDIRVVHISRKVSRLFPLNLRLNAIKSPIFRILALCSHVFKYLYLWIMCNRFSRCIQRRTTSRSKTGLRTGDSFRIMSGFLVDVTRRSFCSSIGQEGPELEPNTRQSEKECEKYERFLGILLWTGSPGRYIPTVVVPVIILGGEDKCCQPQIRKYYINAYHEKAESTTQPHRSKGREEEDDRYSRNHLDIFAMFSTKASMDKVRSEADDD